MKARSLPLLAVTALLAASPAFAATPAAGGAACAGSAGPGMAKLTVDITNLRSSQGEVQITVYPNDPQRFLAPHGKVARTRIPAATPVAPGCFWLPPAAYAVAVYHDENDNHIFDRTARGTPAEGYGFSNDAQGPMGLPAFDAVRFALPAAGRTIRIKMNYPPPG
jgi:uncharacterized protein (DUF2141 family)